MIDDERFPRLFRFPWRSRHQIQREVDAELFFHLECQVENLQHQGLSEEDARQEANRLFGDLEKARAALKSAGRRRERSRRRQMMWSDFLRDIRYAWRSLRRAPGFSATAILVLALGIGINAAIFSIVNMMLVRPILIAEPAELIGVYSQDTERPETWRAFSYPTYRDIREQNDVFSGLAAHAITLAGVTEGDVTKRMMAGVVSSNFFATLGVPISHGRTFTPAEEDPGSDAAVAMVSYPYWRQQKTDEILGSTIIVNGRSLTIIGVTPEGFTGTTALMAPDLWLPLGIFEAVASMPGSSAAIDLRDRKNGQLMLIGRLQPDLDADLAAPRLEALASHLEAAHPVAQENQTFVMARLPRLGMSTQPADEGFLAAPVILIMAMGGIVLLIACLNLANMFLARGASRRAELAIRLSLGGGRFRLLRQLLCEGLLLSLVGGAAGLMLAYWSTRWLFSSISELLPFGINLMLNTSPDLRVFAATLGFCLLATLLAGLGPAWKQASGDLIEGLRETRGLAGGKGRLAPRKILLVGQIALSLALLCAGGLFMRGALAAAVTTPGFPMENVLLAELDTNLAGYDEIRSQGAYRDVLSKLRAMPGIEAASLSSVVPFGSLTQSKRVAPVGQHDDQQAIRAHQYIIGNDYFAALRLPILRGRDFSQTEAFESTSPRIAIIDEPLAKQLWPQAQQPADEALGRSIRLVTTTPNQQMEAIEIVGVVPGIRHQFWDQQPPPHIYLPLGQRFASNLHIHLRLDESNGQAEGLMLAQTRQEIRQYDARLPVLGLKTMHEHRDQSLFLWLVNAGGKFFSLLGLLALFLALVGVYGVNAFVIARRRREIGIRMALGATRGDVLGQMVRENLRLTLIGLAIGSILALAIGKLLSAMIFQADGGAPLVLIIAASLLTAAVLLASIIPARRAANIEPFEALRDD